MLADVNRPTPTEKVFPVSLQVAGRACLVVGGGRIAARKAQALIDCGAQVTLVAPQISAEAAALDATIERRAYRSGEVADYWFVTVAVDDAAVSQQVADDAEAAKVWINSADDPARCSAILPAVLRRGDVNIAVGTSGTAPVLAAWLRDRLGSVVGPQIADVARQVGAQRAAIHADGGSTEGIDWRTILDSLVAEYEGALQGVGR